ncbi:type I-A CRISPR-associated protein Cas4/Csa1 [Desulfothermobacter acidiphilus]|uniref:type I-A CRISPR-associated protein Cas4/Csa1 n=1 Tax=Desulfothermobacter acidiphilus TaxID=1938353 RepID=UPI003F8AB30B
MYFFADEEKKHLLRCHLPRAREQGVVEELRGWNWHQPPLEPVYRDVVLALYEVANAYCPTGRDVYLRRVQRKRGRPNLAMIQGIIFHAVVADVIVAAKRAIYSEGVANYRAIVERIQNHPLIPLDEWAEQLSKDQLDDTLAKAEILATFEKTRVLARLQEILTRQPYIGEDSLVSLALPIVVEQKLDGSFLGLSPNLSTDAFVFWEPMVIDIKFDRQRNFHRLTTTGYALVMEALYEFPVNLGCIVYGEFRGDRLIVKKDIHIIGDELRQWFVETRDEKARLVTEEIDPGKGECYEECPYHHICWGG